MSKRVLMDHNNDILEREGLRRNPCSVPEGYFDSLQERLGAIPRQAGARNRILPALACAAGVAAVLAACVVLLHRPGPAAGGEDAISYEQLAYADLIPHTDPYIYYAESQGESDDPSEEEMLDYLLQNQNY